MKQFIQISFVICFFIVVFLPLLKFNKNGMVAKQENRNLATKPYLLKENRFNKNLFSEYDQYLNDRFGGRNVLISLNSKVKYDVLHGALYNDKALKGKNGWFYYIYNNDGNNLKDFYKTNLYNEQELELFKKNVKNTAEWCINQNISCIFLVCPNKHNIYPEFYPFDRPEGITRADQLVSVLEELGVNYLFPRDYLISKKAEYDFPLYYETDTHWNSQGAYLVSVLLREKIQGLFQNIKFPEIEYETKITYNMSGDILPMLNIKESTRTVPVLEKVGDEKFYTYLKNEYVDGVHTIHTKGIDYNLPRALIFRDSFFTALEPFISPLFSEAEYLWKHFCEDDKDYVLQYKPDIIIFEAVERSSFSICKCESAVSIMQ